MSPNNAERAVVSVKDLENLLLFVVRFALDTGLSPEKVVQTVTELVRREVLAKEILIGWHSSKSTLPEMPRAYESLSARYESPSSRPDHNESDS